MKKVSRLVLLMMALSTTTLVTACANSSTKTASADPNQATVVNAADIDHLAATSAGSNIEDPNKPRSAFGWLGF